MPICALCKTAFFGRGNVTLPLGEPGERCCDACNASKVIPARLAATSKRAASDVDDLDDHIQVSKRARENAVHPYLESVTPKLVPAEAPVEECAPGIEFKTSFVAPGHTTAEVAFKPPSITKRTGKVVFDIMVGLDDTSSMNGAAWVTSRGGAVGLRTVLDDFAMFLEHELKKLTMLDDADLALERKAAVRATTNIKMFKFDERASGFDAFEQGGFDAPCFEQFEPLYAMKDIENMCKAVVKQMQFKGQRTNIDAAVQYAAEEFRRRFDAKFASDDADEVVRIPCLVLLTDGSVTQGDNIAVSILNRADAVVAKRPTRGRSRCLQLGSESKPTQSFCPSSAAVAFGRTPPTRAIPLTPFP